MNHKELNLVDQNLTEIPYWVFNEEETTFLDVSSEPEDSFHAFDANRISYISPSIGLLKNLEELDFSGNRIRPGRKSPT